MKVSFILNDPPCGTGRCYNALRLANAPHKSDPEGEISVFRMADAASPHAQVIIRLR